jgi:hypothetical protein
MAVMRPKKYHEHGVGQLIWERHYSPTVVNIELEEYEHQTIARLVRRYPNSPSMGIMMPTIEMMTRGSRQ